MSKLSLAGVSLVAALPGGLLAWILVSGFLNRIDKMPLLLQIVSGLTLLISAGVVLLPPAALIFGPKAPGAEKKAEKEEKADEAADDEVVEDAAIGEDADVLDESEASAGSEMDDLDATTDFVDHAAADDEPTDDDVVESLDDSGVEMADVDDFDPFEDDDDKKK